MNYYVTRNRLDKLPTTEWDEYDENGLTGKITVGHKLVDGESMPIYKGEESFEIDPDHFRSWFQKFFSDQLETKPSSTESIVEEQGEKYTTYVLEFDWWYGHEKEECDSIKEARARKVKWEELYSTFELTNWKLSSEIRYRQPLNIENQ